MLDIEGVDWDAADETKCGKHGVSLLEIEQVLRGDAAVSFDAAHSEDEDRFFAVATVRSGRPVLVVFTIHERNGLRLARPISARYMSRRGVS